MNSTDLVCDYCYHRYNDRWKADRVDVAPRMYDDQWIINCDYQEEINMAHCHNKYIKELRDRYD